MDTKNKHCSVCGTKTIEAPFANVAYPYDPKSGKLKTMKVNGCPNKDCDMFYQRALMGWYDNDIVAAIKRPDDPWVWVGRIPAKP